MRSAVRHAALALALASLAVTDLAPSVAHADSGMWPFNLIPREQIQKDHGVTVTDGWLDHVRLASVRFNNGGSGSFVSSTGLVLTNHHVGADCIAKLASPGHDFLKDGYVAGQDGPEARCPDLELNVLMGIDDVTDRVRAARQAGMDDAAGNTAMKAAMTGIEKECTDQTGQRCDVVTLYAGGKYNLYKYKKYTDVRLVFAPEQAMAFFGGDPDNFTFPRFDLDMAIFRVFENDRPLAPKEYLRWNEAGPKDGETVFTSGHPGSTSRMATVAELTATRDVAFPFVLDLYKRERDALVGWAKGNGGEGEREIKSERFHLENSLKAITGMEKGLRDPKLFHGKERDEAALLANKPDLARALETAKKAQDERRKIYARLSLLEAWNGSELLVDARDIVRMPAELSLPNDKRLREYRDSALDSLKLRLNSSAPIFAGVQVEMLRVWLETMKKELGANDPAVVALLHGDSPARVAAAMVAGSKLTDVYARRALENGGQAAVGASTDPMIVAARTIDQAARAVRKQFEDDIEGPMRRVGEQVALATFASRGTSVMPDATFTLRLSVGTVKGYTDGGKAIPSEVDFAGMYKHATGAEPFKLTPRWLEAKSRLKLDTPFNLVSTNDIIGGNSGSPLVDANGALVGLIFDGNIQSLPGRFVYDDVQGRAVSVDTAGILEALRKVYKADALVAELLGHG